MNDTDPPDDEPLDRDEVIYGRSRTRRALAQARKAVAIINPDKERYAECVEDVHRGTIDMFYNNMRDVDT